jgi:hypothetical protein
MVCQRGSSGFFYSHEQKNCVAKKRFYAGQNLTFPSGKTGLLRRYWRMTFLWILPAFPGSLSSWNLSA